MPSVKELSSGPRAELLEGLGIVPDRTDAEKIPDLFGEHTGQVQAWTSEKRIIAVIKGWQAGGTVIGTPWLLREIQRTAKAGDTENDYMLITPDFSLLEKRALPLFLEVFAHEKGKDPMKVGYGEYLSAKYIFQFSPEGMIRLFGKDFTPRPRVLMAHAQKPESVEAVALKGLWGDEAGQFSDDIWEAVNARTARYGARSLLTSRPYFHNWYKRECWDKREDPESIVEVISFPSNANPAFPPEEWERQKKMLPKWKFDMKYGGIFTRPGGAVYDNLSEDDYEEPFDVPPDWERVYGVDFGQVHTAVTCFAKDPVKKDLDGLPLWHWYRTYFPNRAKSIRDHVKKLHEAETAGRIDWAESTGRNLDSAPQFDWPPLAFGGAPAEDESRQDWAIAGIPVMRPRRRELMAGIEAVYAAFQRKRVKIFKSLKDSIVQMESYSWELDDMGEPVPGKIQDKSIFHVPDAARYAIVSAIDGTMASQDSRYSPEPEDKTGGSERIVTV